MHKSLSHSIPKSFFPLKSHKKKPSHSKPSPSESSPSFPFTTDYSSKVHLFLFLLYSGTSINIVLPPSYLIIKSASRRALYYYKEGELHMESDSQILERFFEISKDSEIRKYRQPQFIHFTKESIKIYSDELEARKSLHESTSEFTLLQKYIPSSTKYAKKVRVTWNIEKGFSYCVVSNKNAIAKTQWFLQESTQKRSNSSYFHNISQYAYAGRLLKTSLSPLNLYKSVLKPTQVLPKSSKKPNTGDLNRQPSMFVNNFDLNIYLSKQSDLINSIIVPVHIKYLHLESVATRFLKLINTWTERLNAPITFDVCFDFIEDPNGRWYLVGCKCKQLKVELLLQSVSLRRFIRNNTHRTYTEKKIDHLPKNEEEYLQKKLKDFHQRLSSVHVSASEVSRTTVGNEKIYSDFIDSLNQNTWKVKNEEKVEYLSTLAELYDNTVVSAQVRKKEIGIQKELKKEYEKKKWGVEEFINEIVLGLGSHELFGKYFRSAQRVSGLRVFLDNLLQGKPPIRKNQVHLLLKDLGINKHNFQEFLMLVNNALEKIYDDHYKEMVLIRIIDYSKMRTLLGDDLV